MPELPSGTVTFLFSDIEGSTALLRQLRDRYGDVLADHERFLGSALCFCKARHVVRAAVAGQRALLAHPQRLQDFDRPIGIFQLVAADLPAELPPLRTLDTLPRRHRPTWSDSAS